MATKKELEYIDRFYLRASKNANEQPSFPDNEYAGTSDPTREIIRRAVYDNTLVSEELVTVVSGIKKQETLHRLDMDFEFRDRNSRFVGYQKEKEFAPIVLAPVVYGIQEEWDFTNLRDTWFAQNPGAFNDRIPREVIEQAVMAFIDENVPNYNDALYLRGKSRTPQFNITPAYLGFEEQIAAATNSKKYIS